MTTESLQLAFRVKLHYMRYTIFMVPGNTNIPLIVSPQQHDLIWFSFQVKEFCYSLFQQNVLTYDKSSEGSAIESNSCLWNACRLN